jgi:uncharacterized membrane protein
MAILVSWSSKKMTSAMPSQSQTPASDLNALLLFAMLLEVCAG